MKITEYKLKSKNLSKKIKIALVSDVHDRPVDKIIGALKEIAPDIIAIPGDLTTRLDLAEGERAVNERGEIVSHENAFVLLCEAAKIAPTYYSLGNHELCGHFYKRNFGNRILHENFAKIKESGAVFLDDGYIIVGDIVIGGLTSGMTNESLIPHTGWLEGFAAADGFKILLCHHPEYYFKYLEKYKFDLVLSGHAHGGQIRLFGRGLYAPGQGILPKYTAGVHDGRLVIGTGLCNTGGIIPRLFNPREIVTVEIFPE